MDLGLVRRLASPDGSALLAAAETAYAERADALAAAARLRERAPGADPALLSAALTQVRLRRRAIGKLDAADAARVLLTDDGLQQATRAVVARHRAARIVERVGAGADVLDLCCGVGGDLVELARAGLRVRGVDADPVAAALARHNADALGVGDRVDVVVADAEGVARSAYAATTVDPARRQGGRRVSDPSATLPPWSFVLEVLRGAACAEVAPGIDRALVPDGVEAEWVSVDGDVVEAALWSGRLSGSCGGGGAGVRRRATLLTTEPRGATTAATLTDADDRGGRPGPLGRWLYEPDGAVIRAGLVTAVAPLVGGALLDARIAYLSGPALVPTPFARAYEVLDVLPYDVRRLRAYLRERGVGALTVKKRGVGVEPEELRRAMRLRGDAEATVVVTRVAGTATVLVVRPVVGT